MGRRERWTEEELDGWIGTLLRWGVVVAAGVTAVGAALYLARHGHAAVDHREFRGVERGMDSVHGVVAGVLAGQSRAIVQLGVLLLIATPVARVALSLFAFLAQKDAKYVVITAIVLVVLLGSLLGG